MTNDQMILAGLIFIGNVVAALLLDKKDKKYAEEKLESQAHLTSLLFKWKDEHEKESSKVWSEYSKQIAELSAMVKVAQTQYAEIIRRLDELRQDFYQYRTSHKD